MERQRGEEVIAEGKAETTPPARLKSWGGVFIGIARAARQIGQAVHRLLFDCFHKAQEFDIFVGGIPE